MNTCFIDQNKKVAVKTLADVRRMNREILGAHVFSQFVTTTTITKIDTRTVLMTLQNGNPGTCIDKNSLNNLLFKMYLDIYNNTVYTHFSYTLPVVINDLMSQFIDQKEVYKLLKNIKDTIKDQPLFPVHGDIQKENIFINKNKLGLIDFEHFCYAPIELELVNSLFFNDKNCVDIQTLIPLLLKKKIIKTNMLKQMLVFYAIKELSQGRNILKVQNNLGKGISRLCLITNTELKTPKLMGKQKRSNSWTESSCFA